MDSKYVYSQSIYGLSSPVSMALKLARPPRSNGDRLTLRGLTLTAANWHRNETEKRREVDA